MGQEIILNSDKSLTDKDVDTEISKKLDEAYLSISDSVDEMKKLMTDAKNNGGAEALKVRLDLIKHTQALHGSRASKTNINVGIFMHPQAGNKLNY